MEDAARYRLPADYDVEQILSQAVSSLSAQMEKQKEEILLDILARRWPALAGRTLAELAPLLQLAEFAGHQLVIEQATGHPIVFFLPAETLPPKFGEEGASFMLNLKYLEGHAGAQEFYRIRAQYHAMD